MTFQIHALPSEPFSKFFAMSDETLSKLNAKREIVQSCPGTPCRVSLEDARNGETVVLVNYEHLSVASPYKSSHAIFVREGVNQAHPLPDTVPAVFNNRLISVRIFNADHLMIDADVVDGSTLSTAIELAFKNDDVAYIHLHYAKPGCFAASVTRQ